MLENYQAPDFISNKALETSEQLLDQFKKRRTVRKFKKASIDRELIINAIKLACLAPNGANKQPWTMCIIENQVLKEKIRLLAEEEEKKFYDGAGNEKWKNDLKHLYTNFEKPFLTEASFLIPIFAKNYELSETGETTPNYYVKESVGIMTGFLISCLHQLGLSMLTYTPSKMQFLNDLLKRPRNEKIYLVLVVGISHPEAQIPIIEKKPIDEVLKIYK